MLLQLDTSALRAYSTVQELPAGLCSIALIDINDGANLGEIGITLDEFFLYQINYVNKGQLGVKQHTKHSNPSTPTSLNS